MKQKSRNKVKKTLAFMLIGIMVFQFSGELGVGALKGVVNSIDSISDDIKSSISKSSEESEESSCEQLKSSTSETNSENSELNSNVNSKVGKDTSSSKSSSGSSSSSEASDDTTSRSSTSSEAYSDTASKDSTLSISNTTDSPGEVYIEGNLSELIIGQSYNLYGYLYPGFLGVTYWSEDSSIATVNSNGTVTGVGYGKTRIWATSIDYPWISSYNDVTIWGNTNPARGSIYISDGVYYFKNEFSGKYLDVTDGSTSDGAPIQQWDKGSGLNQRWVVRRYNGDYYTIKPISALDKALDVTGGSPNTGADVEQYYFFGSSAQHWRILTDGWGRLMFVPMCSPNCALSIDFYSGNSADNGTKMFEWPVNNYDSRFQHWISEYGNDPIAEKGVYRIINLQTGKCLNLVGNTFNESPDDPENPNHSFNTDVKMSDIIKGSRNQMWRLTYTPDGYYRFFANELSYNDNYIDSDHNATDYARNSNRVLDITGDNVDVYQANSNYYNDSVFYLNEDLCGIFSMWTSNSNFQKLVTSINDDAVQSSPYNGSESHLWFFELVGYGNFTNESNDTLELPKTHVDRILRRETYSTATAWELTWTYDRVWDLYLLAKIPATALKVTDMRDAAYALDWFLDNTGENRDNLDFDKLNRNFPDNKEADFNDLHNAANFLSRYLPESSFNIATINEWNYEISSDKNWKFAVGNYRTKINAAIVKDPNTSTIYINSWYNFMDLYDWDKEPDSRYNGFDEVFDVAAVELYNMHICGYARDYDSYYQETIPQ